MFRWLRYATYRYQARKILAEELRRSKNPVTNKPKYCRTLLYPPNMEQVLNESNVKLDANLRISEKLLKAMCRFK